MRLYGLPNTSECRPPLMGKGGGKGGGKAGAVLVARARALLAAEDASVPAPTPGRTTAAPEAALPVARELVRQNNVSAGVVLAVCSDQVIASRTLGFHIRLRRDRD